MPDADEPVILPAVLDPDDTDEGESYCEGDVDLGALTPEELANLVTLGGQVEAINAIEDDDERLEAAKAWAEELGG